MSFKAVKHELAALRAELGQQSSRKWISIVVPSGMAVETLSAWLDDSVGQDWRRHVIVRLVKATADAPSILQRVPVGETAGLGALILPAGDAGLL